MDIGERTEDRIADGALRLVARLGVREVAMSDISHEAGVSRGTLYRYFPSRDAVLAAAERRVEQALGAALDSAISRQPQPERRLEVVLAALHAYVTERPALLQILEAEPRLALDYFARRLPVLVGLLARSLQPVLAAAPVVRDRLLDEEQLAEVVLRTLLARRMLPSPAATQTDEQELLVVSGLLGVPAAQQERWRQAG